MSDIRGARIAMIFQEPMTSLNPAYTIGNQLEEALLRHKRVSRRQARERAVYLLERVGITAAASRLKQYPHQLSGGLRQRVMIAMALMCSPGADPRRRADDRARRHHPGADPAPAGRVAARVRHGARAHHPRPRRGRPHRHARRGHVCGRGGRDRHGRGDLLQPAHPYTRGLLACIPVPGRTRAASRSAPSPAWCPRSSASRPAAISPAAAVRDRRLPPLGHPARRGCAPTVIWCAASATPRLHRRAARCRQRRGGRSHEHRNQTP